MEDIYYRVFLPQTGKFYHFITLSRLIQYFTSNELDSLINYHKADIDVILNAEVVGSISLERVYQSLFNFEKVPV